MRFFKKLRVVAGMAAVIGVLIGTGASAAAPQLRSNFCSTIFRCLISHIERTGAAACASPGIGTNKAIAVRANQLRTHTLR